MAYLKNRSSQEVIDGDLVTRFNGNNCTRDRPAVGSGRHKSGRPAYWITKAQKSAAYKRVQENVYRRRYLGA